MANFQTISLIVAVVLLIVCLVVIRFILVQTKNTQQWPPLVGGCPDYWTDSNGDGSQCVNKKNLGTCNGSIPTGQHLTMDFTAAPYAGAGSSCSKYTWANGCGLTWDGITSGVSNPCIPP